MLKIFCSFLLIALCACATLTAPEGFWLTEPKGHTPGEIENCRKSAVEFIQARGLVELQNILKRYKERTKEKGTLPGFDYIYCSDFNGFTAANSLASAGMSAIININKEDCLYEAKNDRWLCFEAISKLPKPRLDLRTDSGALNADDKTFLADMDAKSKKRSPIASLEILSVLTASMQTQNRLSAYDREHGLISSTPLELLHELIVTADYLAEFRIRNPSLYTKLIIDNAKNRLAFHTFFDEADTAIETWRKKLKEESTRTAPASYGALYGMYDKIRPKVKF